MADLRQSVLREGGRVYLHDALLTDHPALADAIGAFLTRPEVAARIEAAFFTVDDPRLQQFLSDAA